MRRFAALVIVLVVPLLAGAFAVAIAAERVVSINPLGLVVGIYNLSYEGVSSDGQTYVVAGEFISWDLGDWKLSGMGASAGLRFYPRYTAPSGFYYGPQGAVAFVSATYTDPFTLETFTGQGTTFSVGGVAGYQWISQGGFAFNLSAGVAFSFGAVSAGGYTAPTSGMSPALGFSLGYAW